MSPNEYQEFARANMNTGLSNDEILVNCCLGIGGEGGEVADLIKKHIFQGHALDVDKVVLEVGDVCWYLANLLYALNMTFEDALVKNVEKLRKRYPNGFEAQKSINRPAE